MLCNDRSRVVVGGFEHLILLHEELWRGEGCPLVLLHGIDHIQEIGGVD